MIVTTAENGGFTCYGEVFGRKLLSFSKQSKTEAMRFWIELVAQEIWRFVKELLRHLKEGENNDNKRIG